MEAVLMEVLKKGTVHIKNRHYVEEVRSRLIKDGAPKLQVIADYDYTISRWWHENGTRSTSTYGIIESTTFLNEDYRKEANLLFEHFYPIEKDPNLTRAEKFPFMEEWYTKQLNLMTKSGLMKQNIGEMVKPHITSLRDGCDLLFQKLHNNDVPLLIFSAGVGDILKEIIQQENLLFPNVKIIANFMKFDDEGNMKGFQGDVIHVLNKNLCSLQNNDYFQQLKPRTNAILLGDSLGDLDMLKGAENISCSLKIGFLNSMIEENLLNYLDAYDIVLTDDQTMDIPVALLQSILKE